MTFVWVAVFAYILFELITRGALTRVVLAVALGVFAGFERFALLVMRSLRPPRFVLLGECYRCGECCRMITAKLPRWLRAAFLERLFLLYHRLLHNFREVARADDGTIVFACGHLLASGRCGIYRRRPLLCRFYPVLPFFEPPQLMPACSFMVAPRVVARLRVEDELRLINPGVVVHHPTRDDRAALSQEEDYEWLEDPTTLLYSARHDHLL